jgi:hypothetical protein
MEGHYQTIRVGIQRLDVLSHKTWTVSLGSGAVLIRVRSEGGVIKPDVMLGGRVVFRRSRRAHHFDDCSLAIAL